jgi:hypothetical protein
MKFLIFKSKTTGAVYSYNGLNVVTISNSETRPVGKIMYGFENKYLDKVFIKKTDYFNVGDAEYQILTRI